MQAVRLQVNRNMCLDNAVQMLLPFPLGIYIYGITIPSPAPFQSDYIPGLKFCFAPWGVRMETTLVIPGETGYSDACGIFEETKLVARGCSVAGDNTVWMKQKWTVHILHFGQVCERLSKRYAGGIIFWKLVAKATEEKNQIWWKVFKK